jgi:hypothetical protein
MWRPARGGAKRGAVSGGCTVLRVLVRWHLDPRARGIWRAAFGTWGCSQECYLEHMGPTSQPQPRIGLPIALMCLLLILNGSESSGVGQHVLRGCGSDAGAPCSTTCPTRLAGWPAAPPAQRAWPAGPQPPRTAPAAAPTTGWAAHGAMGERLTCRWRQARPVHESRRDEGTVAVKATSQLRKGTLDIGDAATSILRASPPTPSSPAPTLLLPAPIILFQREEAWGWQQLCRSAASWELSPRGLQRVAVG